MFFIAGITDKVKDLGRTDGVCPACGREGALHITTQYMTPHIFFIPTFRFKESYIVTCGHCAAMMDLDREKGRVIERGREHGILPQDMRLLRQHTQAPCRNCGAVPPKGSAFCNQCGERL